MRDGDKSKLRDKGIWKAVLSLTLRVHHLLNFGHQKEVRRDMCNVGDETSFVESVQLNNETSNFLAEFPELDQGVLSRYEWRVAS